MVKRIAAIEIQLQPSVCRYKLVRCHVAADAGIMKGDRLQNKKKQPAPFLSVQTLQLLLTDTASGLVSTVPILFHALFDPPGGSAANNYLPASFAD